MPSIYSYGVESGSEVHQHITKEAQKTWITIPDEIKAHLEGDIHTDTRTWISTWVIQTL